MNFATWQWGKGLGDLESAVGWTTKNTTAHRCKGARTADFPLAADSKKPRRLKACQLNKERKRYRAFDPNSYLEGQLFLYHAFGGEGHTGTRAHGHTLAGHTRTYGGYKHNSVRVYAKLCLQQRRGASKIFLCMAYHRSLLSQLVI